jgi:hypothetical protein
MPQKARQPILLNLFAKDHQIASIVQNFCAKTSKSWKAAGLAINIIKNVLESIECS